jgi:hypothetical protein
VLEVQDGIIAIFKQPLGTVTPSQPRSVETGDRELEDDAPLEPRDYSGYENEPEAEAPADESLPNNKIGAIRIE